MSKPWKPGPFPLSKYVHYKVVTANGKGIPVKYGKPHTNRTKVEERAVYYTACTGQVARVEMI